MIEAVLNETLDGRADLSNLELEIIDIRMEPEVKYERDRRTICSASCFKPACFPIALIIVFVAMVVLFPIFNDEIWGTHPWVKSGVCNNTCKFQIAESIPIGLTYGPGAPKHLSTYDAWKLLLDSATTSVDMAVFYFSLKNDSLPGGPFPSAYQGQDIHERLMVLGKRTKSVRIALSQPSDISGDEWKEYRDLPNTEVRLLNMTRWFGSGVVHTKLWVVDDRHLYVGSANMDWRSLTQVKELGVLITDCPCLALDVKKIFEVYWKMGGVDAELPKKWADSYDTRFNAHNPLLAYIANSTKPAAYDVFFSSSPPGFSPANRQDDAAAIVTAIDAARDYVHVAVMDYDPATLYMPHNTYWPKIDDALRRAAFDRGVAVRLLFSHWAHTHRDMWKYLGSLYDFAEVLKYKNGSLEIRMFTVNATAEQAKIPFSRVNHNKYMVTESTAFIGTSNWAGDYFLSTAGIGFTARATTAKTVPSWDGNFTVSAEPLVGDVQNIFLRDWLSPYAAPFIHYAAPPEREEGSAVRSRMEVLPHRRRRHRVGL